jgi:hypothetical protein
VKATIEKGNREGWEAGEKGCLVPAHRTTNRYSRARPLFCILSQPYARCTTALVSMTTTVLEELEGGLDSCLASKDLSALLESCPGWLQENKAQGTVN